MTGEPETDRRARWRRKRHAAVFLAVLTFPIAYALVEPATLYCRGRGWISRPTAARIGVVGRPLRVAFETTGFSRTAVHVRWCRFNGWCSDKGYQHRAGIYDWR